MTVHEDDVVGLDQAWTGLIGRRKKEDVGHSIEFYRFTSAEELLSSLENASSPISFTLVSFSSAHGYFWKPSVAEMLRRNRGTDIYRD